MLGANAQPASLLHATARAASRPYKNKLTSIAKDDWLDFGIKCSSSWRESLVWGVGETSQTRLPTAGNWIDQHLHFATFAEGDG